MFSRGQLHQQCCEEWTLVSEETQAKMARMAAAAAWGLGNHSETFNIWKKRLTMETLAILCLTDSVQQHNQTKQQ